MEPMENTNKQNTLVDKTIAVGRPFFRGEFGRYYKADNNDIKNRLIVTMTDIKLLFMALTKIKWTEQGNMFDVALDKTEICEVLGIKKDYHATHNICRACAHLSLVSHVHFKGEDRTKYKDGNLVYGSTGDGDTITLHLNGTQFAPLFEDLLKDKDFLTIWVNDIYKLNNTHSYMLYENLRLYSDTRKVNKHVFSDSELKSMFRIPEEGKGSFMHKVNNTMQFNRSEFEKKVLGPAVKEVANCEVIRLKALGRETVREKVKAPDGSMYVTEREEKTYFRKIKEGGKVIGYEFEYRIVPKEKTAEYISGPAENKQTINKTKETMFSNFDQRTYDYDALEEALINKQDK